MVRMFGYPVGRLAIGRQPEPIAPGRRWNLVEADPGAGPVRHVVVRCRELDCDARKMGATRKGGVRRLLTRGKFTVNTNCVPVSRFPSLLAEHHRNLRRPGVVVFGRRVGGWTHSSSRPGGECIMKVLRPAGPGVRSRLCGS